MCCGAQRLTAASTGDAQPTHLPPLQLGAAHIPALHPLRDRCHAREVAYPFRLGLFMIVARGEREDEALESSQSVN
jgi:hypothetical protein